MGHGRVFTTSVVVVQRLAEAWPVPLTAEAWPAVQALRPELPVRPMELRCPEPLFPAAKGQALSADAAVALLPASGERSCPDALAVQADPGYRQVRYRRSDRLWVE